jgi:SagB-type dehydrogenase family enzyme
VRSPRKKPTRKIAPVIAIRLNRQLSPQMQADGSIAVSVDGNFINLGHISPAAMDCARSLTEGLPLASFAGKGAIAREVDALARRLARHGLLEYRLSFPRDPHDLVVIEPQVAEYWPRRSKLRDTDTVVLSRFAYLRRRGHDMVLESPRAGALFRIGDPAIAATLAALSQPLKISRLCRDAAFNLELLELLLESQILLKLDPNSGDGQRVHEGDGNLVLWDFHDLVMHTRSTEGRHANPVGGTYAYADVVSPLPAVRPPWLGKKIDLRKSSTPGPVSPFAALLRERHSTRDFDDQHPITLAELAQFLDSAVRVLSEWKSNANSEKSGPEVTYSTRPYPAAGSAYELELYLAVSNCEGLARGLYHYDAGSHALAEIEVSAQQLQALSSAAVFAMDASGPPQVLITIAARFGRISWKYSSIAYSLILKDVGSMLQTLYLTATDMGLGGCAIGTGNIDLFAQMTGLDFHVEGPVGQFALGRGKSTSSTD